MRRERLIVSTDAGQVSGLRDGAICAFKGVPYARGPERALRFQPPQPVAPWTGSLDCGDFGPQSVQTNADLAIMGPHDVVGLLFDPPEWQVSSEDCLNLNVWTPAADGAKRPVMVWLHSGGFFSGTASTQKCSGRNLSEGGDVVVVSVNHRLGLLGFLHLADLCGDDYWASGNAGLLDMVAALDWVKRNIAAFGGDPDNVTIFGESGGGGKVNSLMACPSAKGLFHKAIVQSGPWRRFWSRDDATLLAERVLDGLGIRPKGIADLSQRPVAEISAVQTAVMGWLMQRPVSLDGAQTDRAFGPVADGRVLPWQPSDAQALALSAEAPLLIGANKDEGTFMLAGDPDFLTLSEDGLVARLGGLFADKAQAILDAYRRDGPDAPPSELFSRIATDLFLRTPSIATAEQRVTGGAAPVFMYQFDYETSVLAGRLKATHGLEIPFVFDTVDTDPFAGTNPERFALAERVRDAWTSFARTGDPNHNGLPVWPRYDLQSRPTMRLDVVCERIDDPQSGRRDLWAQLR